MKWCELTILAGASSLSDVSNVIYSSWSGVPTWNKPPLNIDLAWLPAGEGRLGRFMFCDITMAVIVNTEADTFHGYNRYYMDINHEYHPYYLC